jgi:hypothetical protein
MVLPVLLRFGGPREKTLHKECMTCPVVDRSHPAAGGVRSGHPDTVHMSGGFGMRDRAATYQIRFRPTTSKSGRGGPQKIEKTATKSTNLGL